MIDALLPYPAEPDSESDVVIEDTSTLRYDDVIQDGRLRLESAWRPTGRALWTNPEVARVLGSMGEGTSNVLSSATMQASELALRPRAKMTVRLRYRFEHTVNADGKVDRLLFSTWLVALAESKDGELRPAARAYGQRVFTRTHAAKGQHLLTHLSGFGESGVPEHRTKWEPASKLLTLPEGAVVLDARPRLVPGNVVFGLSHTDLNQHVNFLMYHREVERAALTRFTELGLGSRFLSREVTFGYRKPSFAGEVVRVAVQAFRLKNAVGVLAAVVPEDSGPAERESFQDFGSPRNVSRMVLRP
jgi:hypothetical protein